MRWEAVALNLASRVAVRPVSAAVAGQVGRPHIDVMVEGLALVGRAVPGDRLYLGELPDGAQLVGCWLDALAVQPLPEPVGRCASDAVGGLAVLIDCVERSHRLVDFGARCEEVVEIPRVYAGELLEGVVERQSGVLASVELAPVGHELRAAEPRTGSSGDAARYIVENRLRGRALGLLRVEHLARELEGPLGMGIIPDYGGYGRGVDREGGPPVVVVESDVDDQVPRCSAGSGRALEQVVAGTVEAPEADLALAFEPLRVGEGEALGCHLGVCAGEGCDSLGGELLAGGLVTSALVVVGA